MEFTIKGMTGPSKYVNWKAEQIMNFHFIGIHLFYYLFIKSIKLEKYISRLKKVLFTWLEMLPDCVFLVITITIQ